MGPQKQSTTRLFTWAVIIRLGFLLLGMLGDRLWSIKYTDYDYKVYNDASKRILQGKSPYDRITYRYTPLLAYILIPSVTVLHEFGKILFITFDLISGFLLNSILDKFRVANDSKVYALALWAYCPLTIIISTRGNADSLIVMLSLLTLQRVLSERYIQAALCFGLAVHFKIYPVIYAAPLFLFIESQRDPVTKSPWSWMWMKIWNRRRLTFAFVSAGVFFGLIGVFYMMYGYEFLFETYLYHFSRQDHRHNLSFHFYLIYLFYDSGYSGMIGSVAFFAQWILIFFFGFRFYKDIGVCMFFQSLIFVVFNKVCTAQYFIWFLGLLPLLAYNNQIWHNSKKLFVFIWVTWFATECAMLAAPYKVEMRGENAFRPIFGSNCIFFIESVALLCVLLHNQELVDVGKRLRKLS